MKPPIHAMIAASALASLAPAAIAAPVPTESELRAECSGDPGGQAGMRDCLDRKARTSAVTLQQAEARTMAALRKVDPWPRFVAMAQQSLVAADREFVRYRAAHCAFNMSLVGGAAGNSREIMRLACVAELNLQRAEQLNLQAGYIGLRERD